MKKFILVCFLISLSFFVEAKQVKVMLHLNKVLQVDTIGHNILEVLPGILYPYITEGKVKLWDGPSHRLRIEGDALRNLEKGSGTLFTNCHEMFLYESWDIRSKDINAKSIGIMFTSRNLKGEEISFGFVDYDEIIRLIGKIKVPVNANGNTNITFEQLFAFRRFDYNIVQFDGRTMKSLEESMKLKNDISREKIFKTNVPPVPFAKLIRYEVVKPVYPVNILDENAAELLNVMGAYLSSHMEDFLNMGGDVLSEGKLNYKVNVSNIHVQEEWVRRGAEIISLPMSFQIFVGGKALKEISYSRILDWNIYVNLYGLDDLIREKKFSYSIIKINQQEIPEGKSEIFLRGLREYDWSKLTEYVKYF